MSDSDDTNESVAQAVVTEFTALRLVVSDICKNSTSSRTEMIIDGSKGQKDMSDNLNVDTFGHVLDLLASSVLYHPEKDHVKHSGGGLNTAECRHEEMSNTNANGAPRLLAIEELLHTAATGMRCLVSSTCGHDFSRDFFLEENPWPLIPRCNDASTRHESSIVRISTAHLCATIKAVGQILASLSLLRPNNEGVSTSTEKGAEHTKVALKAALLNSKTRRIIAASSDLLHKCLLISADTAVLECSRMLLPQVLNILPTCYSDLSDPFSLGSLSAMHSLRSQVLVQQSGSSVDRILREEARNVGSLRNHVGQIIAFSCQNADENYTSNLIRVLNHKLSKLSLSTLTDNDNSIPNKTISADALTESDLILIAGTITALGSTAEGIAAWMNTSEGHVNVQDVSGGLIQVQRHHIGKRIQSKAVVDIITTLLLDTISGILNLTGSTVPQSTRNVGSAKDPVIEKDRFSESKIVALKVLRDFAGRGLLRINDNSDGDGDDLNTNSTECIVIEISNTGRITKILDYLVDYVKSFSVREAGGVSNTPINGRSTTSSKIAAAAIDVLSTACLMGVAEGAVIRTTHAFIFKKLY